METSSWVMAMGTERRAYSRQNKEITDESECAAIGREAVNAREESKFI